MLIKLVEHDVCVNVPLKLYYYLHALPVAGVMQVAYALYALFVNKLGYLFNKPCFVDLIRYLRHDYAAFSVVQLLYLRPGAHKYPAPAGPVGLPYAGVAHYYAARGEIRPGQIGHKLFNAYFRIIEHGHISVYSLAKVMRRNVGSHADSYAV